MELNKRKISIFFLNVNFNLIKLYLTCNKTKNKLSAKPWKLGGKLNRFLYLSECFSFSQAMRGFFPHPIIALSNCSC